MGILVPKGLGRTETHEAVSMTMQSAALHLHSQFTAWTEEAVLWRFIEAADTMRRLPPVNGPMAYGSTMPDIVRNYADAVAAEETRDPKEWNDSFHRKPKATAVGIRRMEEVMDWHLKYSAANPGPVICIWAYAIAKVRGFKIGPVADKMGISRQGLYGNMRRGLQLLVQALNAAHVPCERSEYENQMGTRLDTVQRGDVER